VILVIVDVREPSHTCTVRLQYGYGSVACAGPIRDRRALSRPALTCPYRDRDGWPTLQAAIELGGFASIAELDAAVIEREQLTPQQQGVLLSGGPQTVVQNMGADLPEGYGPSYQQQARIWRSRRRARPRNQGEHGAAMDYLLSSGPQPSRYRVQCVWAFAPKLGAPPACGG
jgi:hypothetical protein